METMEAGTEIVYFPVERAFQKYARTAFQMGTVVLEDKGQFDQQFSLIRRAFINGWYAAAREDSAVQRSFVKRSERGF